MHKRTIQLVRSVELYVRENVVKEAPHVVPSVKNIVMPRTATRSKFRERSCTNLRFIYPNDDT